MITVISHHYVKEDQAAEADRMIREAGRAMRGFKGLASRQTLHSNDNPLKITTVTTWKSQEDQEAWFGSAERQSITGGGHALWSKPPQQEFFELVPEL